MTAPIPTVSALETDTVERAWRPWIWGVVVAAILLRLRHFAMNPAVWIDELWLLRNIVRKNFAEMLGPLTDVQAAPPAFLWVEHAISLAFGDNIFALRIPPLLASCAMIVLLALLGRGLIRSPALVVALVLTGFSDKLLDYTCETKPYVVDGLVGIALSVVFRATQSWSHPKRLLLFAGLAPLVLFTSYAGIYVYGGIFLALLPDAWAQRRQRNAWLGWLVLMAAVAGTFYYLLTGPIHAQRTPLMEAYWQDYPDWRKPWIVPFWSINVFVQYIERLWRPTGFLLLVPIVVGATVLWRRGRRTELVLLIAPVLLAMFAAWLRKYPFETRLLVFNAGQLMLLAGEGLIEIGLWFKAFSATPDQNPKSLGWKRMTQIAVCIAGIALVIPLGHTIKHTVFLRKRPPELWPESPTKPGPINVGPTGYKLTVAEQNPVK